MHREYGVVNTVVFQESLHKTRPKMCTFVSECSLGVMLIPSLDHPVSKICAFVPMFKDDRDVNFVWQLTCKILRAHTESGSRMETKIDSLRSSPEYVSSLIAAYSAGSSCK